jgi:filamentous hemagglutinin
MNFPTTPTDGQVAVVNNIQYQYSTATNTWTRIASPFTTISATGNITAGQFFLGNGSQLTGVVATGIGVLASLSVTGNTVTGNLNTGGQVSATGNVIGGNVSTVGNVTGNYILGNGALLSGIITSVSNINNGTSNVSIDTPNANVTVSINGTPNVAVFATTGEYVTGVISANGTVTGGNLATGGTASASGNITGGNVLTGGLVSATGTITGGNLSVVGNVLGSLIPSANVAYDLGSTSQRWRDLYLSGNSIQLGAATITSSGTGISITSGTGNVISGNVLTDGIVSAGGNATAGNVLTGGLVSATATVTGGNLATGGTASAGGNITGANILTGGLVSATATVTGGNLATGGTASAGGNVTGANILTGGLVSATANVTGGNVLTGGLISATATITGGNVLTGGLISATGNATAANIITGGLVSATANITGGNLETGGTASATGNITGGNILTGGAVSATGNVTGGNVNTNNIVGSGTLSVVATTISLAPTGNINVNNSYINNVPQPVQNQDAATKLYVDNLASTGITYHEAVYVATTATLATTTGGVITYAQPNGAANGVGATLTTTTTFNLIDTANVQTLGTRILVKDQANAVQNGVYVWSNATAITRSTDTDQYGAESTESFSINDYFFTSNGNVNSGTAFIVSSPPGTITFGTSNITFAVFSQSTTYTANTSAGLSLSGTVFSAKVDDLTTAFDGSGNISVKTGAQLTTPNIGAATGTSLSVTGTVTAASTVGGVITGSSLSTSGTVTGSSLLGSVVSVSGNVTGGNVLFGSGIVSGTGNIIGNGLFGSFVTATGNVTGGNLITGGLVSATGNGTFGNLSTSGSGGNISGANVISGTTLSATANVIGGNLTTGGQISSAGNITANPSSFFIGNGSQLTGVVATGIGVLTSLSVTGNTTTGNLLTGGLVSATGNVTGGNVLTGGLISSTGTVTGSSLLGSVVSASGTITGGDINTGGNVSATGNATAGNVLTGGLISATSTITSGATITGGNLATGGTASVTGNITGGNVLTGGLISATSTITSAANIAGGNITTGGQVSAVGNITANTGSFFIGNGSQLSGVTASSVDANNLTGNTLNSGVIFSSLTTVGTLTSLSVSGNTTSGNVLTGGVISATATITGGNLATGGTASAGGNVTGANILTGGLVSATATITGGNLATGGTASAGGNVTGANILTGGLVSATATITGGNLATGGTASATGNITGGNLLTGGLVSATGNVSGNYILGNGALLSGIITSVSNINNGTSNVTIETANANITMAVNGTSNIVVVDNYGINVSGNITATGNIWGGGVRSTASTSPPANPGQGDFWYNTITDVMYRWTYDGTSYYWIDAYGSTVGANANLAQIVNGTTTVGIVGSGGNVAFDIGGVANVGVFYNSGLSITGDLTVTGNATLSGNILGDRIQNGNTLIDIQNPNGNANIQIGGVANTAVFSTTALTLATALLPSANITYDLGSTTQRWKDLYLSNSTIYLGAAQLSANSTAVTITNPGGGTTVLQGASPSVTGAVVSASGNITGGNILTGGQLVSTQTGSATTGLSQIYLNGATNNRIDWNTNGTGAPTTTTRSTGTKLLLYPAITGSTTDYSIGITAGTLWSSIPGYDAGQYFKWYGAATEIASLSGTGVFSTAGNVTAPYFIGNGAALTGLSASKIYNGTSEANIGVSGGNANISIGGTSNVVVVATTGLYVTGLTSVTGTVTAASVVGGVMTGTSLSLSGNTTPGNVLTGGLISATGNITGGNLTVGTGTITGGNIVNANGNGIGNIGSSTVYFNTVFAKATSAQYADLAEMYAADKSYEPGTVVVFGGTKEITVSKKSHTVAIAGIISTNPSYLMNSTLSGKYVVPVALLGRVPCQVVGKIKKGDQLVASDVEGVATVLIDSQYKPGCIIGKALENYNSDEVGTIEVAVGKI